LLDGEVIRSCAPDQRCDGAVARPCLDGVVPLCPDEFSDGKILGMQVVVARATVE
jgi:hypothetical protein